MTSLLSAALLHFVWQGAVLALLLWVALALTRKQAASVRYLICCGALGLMAAMPAVTMWALHQPSRSAGLPVILLYRGAPRWLDLARLWALPVWAFGVAIFSLRMIWFYGQAAWMRRRGEQASEWLIALAGDMARRMGVSQAFSVLVSGEGRGPSVIGWLRPVVLVPAAAIAGLTPEQLAAVLAHELAHIRRADYLVNLLQSVIETLLFYHPAVWWVSGRIRSERELCCDDLAVRSCGDALVYARALTILERFRMTPPRMAMASTGGRLIGRIRRIVGAESAGTATSKAPGVVALAVVLIFAAMGLNRAKAQAPAPVPAPPTAPQAVAPAPKPEVSPKRVVPASPEVDDHEAKALEDNAMLEDLNRQLAELSLTYDQNHPRIRQLQELSREAQERVENDASLEELRARLSELRRFFRPNYPEIVHLQEMVAKAEAEATSEQQALVDHSAARAAGDGEREQLDRMQRLLSAEMDRNMEALKRLAEQDINPVVEKITVSGLANAAEEQMLSQLPVHPGSRLSGSAIRDGYAAVSAFDKSLEFAVVMLPDGKAELRITAPKK